MNAVFFTDRNLGLQFPAILREAGLTVKRHVDDFAADCPDDEWLREVAKRGWIALTHDTRIRYKPNELAAVIEHNSTLLVIVGSAPYSDLAPVVRRNATSRSGLSRGPSSAGHR